MKHFTLDELTRSDTAQRHHIINRPTSDEIVALHALVDNVLDPAREAINQPIIVTSGYRSPTLNRLVGGTPTSQHLRGEAADITLRSTADNLRLARIIAQKLPFDQLILENANPTATNVQWLHVSYSRTGNRHQVLIKYKNRNGYQPYSLK